MAPEDLIADYERTFNENDAAGMNALFTDDATFVNFSGRLVVGRAPLLEAQEAVFAPGGPLAAVQVRYPVEVVTELAPDVVAVHARQVAEGLPQLDGRFLAVLVRVGGDWRIRVGQNTPVA
jgi:uncharacterized protein (TIGR02246 family)